MIIAFFLQRLYLHNLLYFLQIPPNPASDSVLIRQRAHIFGSICHCDSAARPRHHIQVIFRISESRNLLPPDSQTICQKVKTRPLLASDNATTPGPLPFHRKALSTVPSAVSRSSSYPIFACTPTIFPIASSTAAFKLFPCSIAYTAIFRWSSGLILTLKVPL